MERLIETAIDLDRLIRFLGKRPRPFRVAVTDGRPRSQSQNKLMWLWASEAAPQRGMAPIEVQSEWKLTFGVPILVAENPDFAAGWIGIWDQLPWEKQKLAIRNIDVTSRMNVTQLNRFLKDVEQACIDDGVEITDPGELLNAGAKKLPSRTKS